MDNINNFSPEVSFSNSNNMEKYKRKIAVDDQEYIWTLEGNDLYSAEEWIIVTLADTSDSRLYISPFSHDVEVTSRNIAKAIKAARKFGWCPEENHGDLSVEFKNCGFEKIENRN